MKMTRAEYAALLERRTDIHAEMRVTHLASYETSCLARRDRAIINGQDYEFVCGREVGHDGMHEDVQGGVWWPEGGDDWTTPLHVYGQPWEHEEVFLVGSRKGIERLRDALTRALANDDGVARETFMVVDGEGYDIHAVVSDEAEMGLLALPYTDTSMVSPDPGMSPYNLFQRFDVDKKRLPVPVRRRLEPEPK